MSTFDDTDDYRDGVLFRFWIRAASYPGGWRSRLAQLIQEEVMNLTWNQHRALERLADRPDGASPREVGEPFRYFAPYLCVSGARSALMALVRKGLAECHDARSPLRYRITDAGRAALAEGEKP